MVVIYPTLLCSTERTKGHVGAACWAPLVAQSAFVAHTQQPAAIMPNISKQKQAQVLHYHFYYFYDLHPIDQIRVRVL